MPVKHIEQTKEVMESMADIVRSFVAMDDPSTPYFYFFKEGIEQRHKVEKLTREMSTQ